MNGVLIGLIFIPSSNLKIFCYPCADFAGTYNHKKINDHAYVKSRTAYVITVAIPCFSSQNFRVHPALSVMEEKVISLAYSCRELLPIIELVTYFGDAKGLPKDLTRRDGQKRNQFSII